MALVFPAEVLCPQGHASFQSWALLSSQLMGHVRLHQACQERQFPLPRHSVFVAGSSVYLPVYTCQMSWFVFLSFSLLLCVEPRASHMLGTHSPTFALWTVLTLQYSSHVVIFCAVSGGPGDQIQGLVCALIRADH